MSLSPTDALLPQSPIARVPYDVLVEIFIQCLPDQPLYDPFQPDSRLAPMLLCQVCSSWRTVALTCPALWVHLAYVITLEDIEIVASQKDCQWAVSEHDIEFLQWWRKNQGPIAPFLSLRVELCSESEEFEYHPADVLVVNRFSFLLEYISSAQFLDVELLFWNQISRAIQRGSRITFPNLHTLVNLYPITAYYGEHETIFWASQMSIGRQSLPPSPLRYLLIDEAPPDSFVIPPHWSGLTHISLWDDCGVSVSPRRWYSFIRSFPHLQWGHFDIRITHRRNRTYRKPSSRFVFSQLKTLFITVEESDTDIPISSLFNGLYIPTLRTLSLISHNESWKDGRALSQISTILQSSAPNITTLSVGHECLSFAGSVYNPISPLNSAHVQVEPVWMHAPRLEHLQFEFRVDFGTATTAQARLDIDTFIRNVFAANAQWWDLTHPACPIRTITFIDEKYDKVKESATSQIRELNEKIPDIDFQITSESPNSRAENIRWKWGSSL